MENLKLWQQVCQTEKELITDTTEADGAVLRTVAHIHRLRRATELFGVYGKNWGLKNIRHTEITIGESQAVGVADAIFFVNCEACSTEFEISNSAGITEVRNGRIALNYNYRKALESGLLNKALSRLGFNADMYSDREVEPAQDFESEIAQDDSEQVVPVGDLEDDIISLESRMKGENE